jgi:uncharacterized ubiquitin-like protein YukD
MTSLKRSLKLTPFKIKQNNNTVSLRGFKSGVKDIAVLCNNIWREIIVINSEVLKMSEGSWNKNVLNIFNQNVIFQSEMLEFIISGSLWLPSVANEETVR